MKTYLKLSFFVLFFVTSYNVFAQQTKEVDNKEADNYLKLGEKNLQIGRNDLALENYQKALTIYQKTYTEKHDAVADCYNHLGIVYWNTGNNELALDYLNKALAIRQNLYQENHAEVAASYNDMGLVYASTQPFLALEYYEKALTIYQIVYPENHPSIATSYTNIAFIQRSQKQYEEALINFDKSLKIRKIAYEKDHPNEAFAYLSLGQVHSDLDNFDNALDNYLKALTIYKKNYGEKHPEIAQIYNLLASLYLKRNDFAKATQYIQQALQANVIDFQAKNNQENPQAKNYYSGSYLLNSLLLKAQIYENLHYQKTLKFKDLKTALSCLEVCDTLISELRQLRTNNNDKIALGITASEVYEDAIRLCMQMADVIMLGAKLGYEKKAFGFAEKSKAAVLLSAISDTQAKEFAGIPADILENEKELKAEIIFYEQQLANKKDEQITRNKLFELNRNYEVFVKNLEQKYPEYYNLKYNIQTTGVRDLQKVIGNKTAIISYFTAEKQKRLYIFELTKTKFKAYNVPLNEDFNSWITILRNAIVYKVQKEYMAMAHKLYKQLLPIVIPSTIENIVFIPDGRLGIIPFEALLTGKNNVKINEKSKANSESSYTNLPYLLRKYAISYAYAATLFAQNINKKSEASTNSMCLIAPVDFKDAASLKDSETEVNALAKLNTNAKIFVRENAQENLLKSVDIQQYRYIHLATHGVVDEVIPEKSCILLYADKSNKEDGILNVGEIYNIKLKADLVTMSACQTGLGKISKGEGIIGLTRALLYAGAKNVNVSLWKVADNSTKQLMVDFSTPFLTKNSTPNITENTTPRVTQNSEFFAKYLQAAKLKMISENVYAAPFYWSPFVLVGQ